MKKLITLFLIFPFFVASINAQTTGAAQNASQPKDAPIDVTIKDFKGNVLPNEIIVFRSGKTKKE